MKKPFSIIAQKKDSLTAEVRIIGVIGWETNAESFRVTIDELLRSGVSEVEIYINSPGGSVFDANEIVNILSKFKKKRCIGGALVASAAAYIAVVCDEFTMPQNGMLMIHRPSGYADGNSSDLESYLKLLKDVESHYYNVFKKKVKDRAEFHQKWNSADWWLTADEAKNKGLVSSIQGPIEYDTETTDMISKSGAPANLINTYINHNNNNMEFTNDVKKLLNLHDKAEEKEVLAALLPALQERDSLKAKLAEKEKAEKEAQKAETTTLIDKAVADGKLNADNKQVWVEMFEKDFNTAKSALAAIPVRQQISNQLNTGGSGSENKDEFTKLNAMSFDDLDKMNLLKTVKDKYPDMFSEKFEAKYGTKPKL